MDLVRPHVPEGTRRTALLAALVCLLPLLLAACGGNRSTATVAPTAGGATTIATTAPRAASASGAAATAPAGSAISGMTPAPGSTSAGAGASTDPRGADQARRFLARRRADLSD